MSRNNSNNRPGGNEGERGSSSSWGTTAAAVIGGVTALAGGWYLLSRYNNSSTTNPPTSTAQALRERREEDQNNTASQSRSAGPTVGQGGTGTMSDYLSNLMRGLNTNGGVVTEESGRRGVPRSSIPVNPVLSNLNALLSDIYVRYIALNDEDFERYYSVVHSIFNQIHTKMKEADPYFNRYSSTVQYAGSHPDRLRINKPDEFDIDIVIGLPLSIHSNPLDPADSDFVLEPKDAGFIQLKMGVQYQRLHMRDSQDWPINKAAYEWKDDKNYLQRSSFSNWFKSVVYRALNKFRVGDATSAYVFEVAGRRYTATTSESGPAVTLFLENHREGFKLDVDLVPALRFPISRWPICNGYRSVPPEWAVKDYWMVVPKPNKNGMNDHDKHRSWRIAMHEQERMLMHNTNNLRPAIRLLKKLRDAQNMNDIASYYIKTLFFWEFVERNFDRSFWNQNPATLFRIMAKKFHEALLSGRIPYFWNKSNNLIGNVDRGILNRYAAIVGKLVEVLDNPLRYKEVAKFLLTPTEFSEYNRLYLHI